MTQVEPHDDEISLFALGTTLLRNRWRIARWMLLGAGATTLLVISRPALYQASASFVSSQSGDASRTGLANLAGQLGVALPMGNQAVSPEFYAKLLKSRSVLLPIVHDTFVVPALGGKRVPFLDLFDIQGASMTDREERGINLLKKSVVTASTDKLTGVIELTAKTKWRSVSLAIVTELLDGVNNYNQQTRQGQAAAERQFVERRLAVASADLRNAEDNLAHFLQTNRDLGGSAALMLQRERLQRDVNLRQQVFTSLTQSYEDARIREVRDTPVITIFEPPSAPVAPAPRGRAVAVLLGLLLGGFVGALLVFLSELVSRHQGGDSSDATEFVRTLRETRGDWRKLAFWRH